MPFLCRGSSRAHLSVDRGTDFSFPFVSHATRPDIQENRSRSQHNAMMGMSHGSAQLLTDEAKVITFQEKRQLPTGMDVTSLVRLLGSSWLVGLVDSYFCNGYLLSSCFVGSRNSIQNRVCAQSGIVDTDPRIAPPRPPVALATAARFVRQCSAASRTPHAI